MLQTLGPEPMRFAPERQANVGIGVATDVALRLFVGDPILLRQGRACGRRFRTEQHRTDQESRDHRSLPRVHGC